MRRLLDTYGISLLFMTVTSGWWLIELTPRESLFLWIDAFCIAGLLTNALRLIIRRFSAKRSKYFTISQKSAEVAYISVRANGGSDE